MPVEMLGQSPVASDRQARPFSPATRAGDFVFVSGQVPVDQSSARNAVASLNRGVQTLKSGVPLVIFPEGGRTATGEPKPFVAGAAWMAIKAQMPIVPVTLVGTSYSANEVWSFAAFLSAWSGLDVANASLIGQGPVVPMRDFIASLEQSDSLPQTVIWEFPIRYLTDPELWNESNPQADRENENG